MLKRLEPYSGQLPKFGVFDVETSRDSAKDFKFAVVLVNDETYIFHSAEELRNFLIDKQFIGYHFYGHNVEYDLHSIFKNILTIDDSKIIMNGGRFIKLSICINKNIREEKCRIGKDGKETKRYVHFYDTFNLIPMSLKAIGQNLRLKKMSYNEESIENKSEIAIQYCIRDCEIVKLLVERYYDFCRTYHINAKLTTSSTAMAIFRTNFLQKDMWINEKDEFFKNSYIGGRVEVFSKVMKNGYHYDVNSLYPKAMTSGTFPNPSKVKKGVPELLNSFIEGYEGVAHIEIYSPPSYIPVLPYHDPLTKKIIYPVSGKKNLIGWYNFNEIRFAIKRGYKIIKCFEFYYSEKMESPFIDYINHFYKMKSEYKDNNPSFYDFSKRMMNGLYGKFGEYHDSGMWGSSEYDPRSKEEKKNNTSLFDLYDFDEIKHSGFGNWKKKNESITQQKTEHTIFSLCSYVTSYARMILYEELEKSGLENIYYVDTDSKFTTKFQLGSSELGEMKLEEENIYCYFVRPKHYEIINSECRDYFEYVKRSKEINQKKLKGVKLAGKGISNKYYVVRRVLKAKESLRRGLQAGSWIDIVKEPGMCDDKRIWCGGISKAISIE